jgi:hypothetical protein
MASTTAEAAGMIFNADMQNPSVWWARRRAGG